MSSHVRLAIGGSGIFFGGALLLRELGIVAEQEAATVLPIDVWNVVVPCLLALALLVGVLAWGDRVKWAASVFETSPLGSSSRNLIPTGRRIFVVLLAMVLMMVSLAVICLLMFGRAWSAPDIGGVSIVGTILAIIVCLPAIAHRIISVTKLDS